MYITLALLNHIFKWAQIVFLYVAAYEPYRVTKMIAIDFVLPFELINHLMFPLHAKNTLVQYGSEGMESSLCINI